ncbi:cardiolipin synthase [Arthrobacter agilis]|uniref:cardiolipin synthase n=1 Tax=Arthrobacter agilis TaxID=37921 RepID=UPI002366CD0E|nr:cardiolipin synthase [Arthrobacter agilis]WDF33071.1 cardiolipin synthase [Arthrobacter agilis]
MDFQQWWGSVPASITVGVTILDMAIRLAALGIVPHNRRPAAALGWLTVIFFMPVIGLVLFLLFGTSTLGKRRRTLEQHVPEQHLPAGTLQGESTVVDALPEWARAMVRMNESNGGLPVTTGNSADLLPDYEASIDAMTEAVRQAVSFVHVEFYIAVSDDTTEPLFHALEEAHHRGVQVRVLLDHVGSAGFPGYKAATRRLDGAGIAWRLMLPVASPRFHYQRPDLRNHRKVLVIDNRVGFTGSQNIIDASYNKKANKRRGLQWRDLMVRIEGPAVPQLNAVFRADWTAETNEDIPDNAPPITGPPPGHLSCQILPSGPGNTNESNLRLFLAMIYNARDQVTICSPYFVPDESLLLAVTSAVQRGVEVRLLMGSTSDHFLTHHAQRSYYEMLLAAGVAIHLYPEPFVLHSKFVVIDGQVSVVASSNMDIRSFALNQEVNLLVLDADFARRLDAVTDEYLDETHELQTDRWNGRPLHAKFLDNACRLTANLQ